MNATTWYCDGLRWIGSLFTRAADRLERPAAEPLPEPLPWDHFITDVRLRIHARSY